jgi:hypothetical protein
MFVRRAVRTRRQWGLESEVIIAREAVLWDLLPGLYSTVYGGTHCHMCGGKFCVILATVRNGISICPHTIDRSRAKLLQCLDMRSLYGQ